MSNPIKPSHELISLRSSTSSQWVAYKTQLLQQMGLPIRRIDYIHPAKSFTHHVLRYHTLQSSALLAG